MAVVSMAVPMSVAVSVPRASVSLSSSDEIFGSFAIIVLVHDSESELTAPLIPAPESKFWVSVSPIDADTVYFFDELVTVHLWSCVYVRSVSHSSISVFNHCFVGDWMVM